MVLQLLEALMRSPAAANRRSRAKQNEKTSIGGEALKKSEQTRRPGTEIRPAKNVLGRRISFQVDGTLAENGCKPAANLQL